MLGIKENLVDIPYDIITSLKIEKGLLSSTIRFKAPGRVSSTRMGMMDSIADGKDNDPGGIIQAIPNGKAGDLLEIIRSGMLANNKKSSAEKPFGLPEDQNVADLNKYLSTSIADELRKTCSAKK